MFLNKVGTSCQDIVATNVGTRRTCPLAVLSLTLRLNYKLFLHNGHSRTSPDQWQITFLSRKNLLSLLKLCLTFPLLRFLQGRYQGSFISFSNRVNVTSNQLLYNTWVEAPYLVVIHITLPGRNLYQYFILYITVQFDSSVFNTTIPYLLASSFFQNFTESKLRFDVLETI